MADGVDFVDIPEPYQIGTALRYISTFYVRDPHTKNRS